MSSGKTTSDDNARWFAAEVEPHRPALKAWLRVRFPWLHDVDDIAQCAVVRLLQMRSSAVPVKSPKAALYTIARNAAIDLSRRRAIVEIRSIAEIEALSVIDEHTDVAETACTRQELEFLAVALRDLPDRCRQVLTLCKMYGYSPKEIAERLGISENTVRAHIAKGIHLCAKYLRYHGVTGARK